MKHVLQDVLRSSKPHEIARANDPKDHPHWNGKPSPHGIVR
jgi:hypothetical protein